MEYDRDTKPVDGPVEIMIVTHAKDLCWLEYCLKAIRKFCSGFQGITVCCPSAQSELFVPLCNQFESRLHAYDEVAGKGMLQHMVKMAQADIILPDATRYVMHLDSDCIYHTPTVPEDYFSGGRPVYLIRTWESLTTEDPRHPGSKVISDCAQWKEPTCKQLGFDTPWYTMCRHPTVLPIGFYKLYRDCISNVHRDYESYMMSGRNEFPQDRMDWTAVGAFANKFMDDKFHWIDIGISSAPKDRQKTYWSHGGATPSIRSEIESFFKL